MDATFVEDAKIRKAAETAAFDAVDVARDQFNIALDWSEASVTKIETILEALHRENTATKPGADKIWTFSQMFGSYVGEVYRRHHGGRWGMVTHNGNTVPGMQSIDGARVFWPWGLVQKRITNGPADNVVAYYQSIVRGNG